MHYFLGGGEEEEEGVDLLDQACLFLFLSLCTMNSYASPQSTLRRIKNDYENKK